MADPLDLDFARTPSIANDFLGFLKRIVRSLASLKLTVFLFAVAIVMVFCSTLAQRDLGIWSVVDQYYRIPARGFSLGCLFVWIPLRNLIFVDWLPVSFPFPRGWLIGGMLLTNVVAAHALRFRMGWKRSGILLIHSGLIVILLGELVTGLLAVEGNMTILEGQIRNYVENGRKVELALVDASDPKTEDVVVVPESILRQTKRIRHEKLPIEIEVGDYMVNSELKTVAEMDGAFTNMATHGAGLVHVAESRPEVSGTDTDGKADFASAYVHLYKPNGQSLGTHLVSVLLKEQNLTVDDKTYQIALRPQRLYKPYALHLIDFRHEKYLGTDKPKDYSSEVRLLDAERNVDRRIRIYMNHPLRYRGETFYQSSFLPGDIGTVLHVVRNPGWLMPYVSCAMVSIGMLVHFGLHLYGFLGRKRHHEAAG